MMVEAHGITTVSLNPNLNLQTCPMVQALGKGKETGLGWQLGLRKAYIPHITRYVAGKEENQLICKAVLSSVGG